MLVAGIGENAIRLLIGFLGLAHAAEGQRSRLSQGMLLAFGTPSV
jgi:hypothetical protein